MTIEIPAYGLKAYALFFDRYGIRGQFRQSELDWIVSESMRKKIFALLLRSGWIMKHREGTYSCKHPSEAIKGLMDFRVPVIIQKAKKKYAFTQLSAVEIWSDFSYTLRGREKSPYFIKIVKKDLTYWKEFFNKAGIPNYIGSGTTIGEYVIFVPGQKFPIAQKDNFNVDPLKETMQYAKSNGMYEPAVEYMKQKYEGKHEQ